MEAFFKFMFLGWSSFHWVEGYFARPVTKGKNRLF